MPLFSSEAIISFTYSLYTKSSSWVGQKYLGPRKRKTASGRFRAIRMSAGLRISIGFDLLKITYQSLLKTAVFN
jgi:hypothetical protein